MKSFSDLLNLHQQLDELFFEHQRALIHYPQPLQIFMRHGFVPPANPVLRKTMARVVTIEQACRREGVDLAELIAELRTVETWNRPATSEVVVPITRIATTQ